MVDPDRAQPLPIAVRVPPSSYLVEVAAFPYPNGRGSSASSLATEAFLPDAPSKFCPSAVHRECRHAVGRAASGDGPREPRLRGSSDATGRLASSRPIGDGGGSA